MAHALTIFRTQGCLLVENAFPRSFIAGLNASFLKKYRRYFVDKDHPDVAILSRGRYQVTVRLEHPFNDSRLYASPLVLQILRSLLGRDCMIDSFGAAVSIPGSETQVIHRDFPGLFNDDAIDSSLPPYAINCYAPLVDLNETNGTTRMWPGSHLDMSRKAETGVGFMDPLALAGSAILMDYRVWHQGLANQSTQVRPMLYTVYKRVWWADNLNFLVQHKLHLTAANYRKIPKQHRILFPQPVYKRRPRWEAATGAIRTHLGNIGTLRYVYRKFKKPSSQI